MAHWEAFFKKHFYSGHHKSRPSGSALPTAPPLLLPFASASSEAGRPSPLLLWKLDALRLLPSFRRAGSVGGVEGHLQCWLLQCFLCPISPVSGGGGGGGFVASGG